MVDDSDGLIKVVDSSNISAVRAMVETRRNSGNGRGGIASKLEAAWAAAQSGVDSKITDENQEKITEHGKRADAIVKGMLQHSRSSSGVKEPTDINALVDEYLRLAYHGLRAKDKTFNSNAREIVKQHLRAMVSTTVEWQRGQSA